MDLIYSSVDEEAEAEEEKEIDVYDLAEPVDVLAKLSKEFYTQVVRYKTLSIRF